MRISKNNLLEKIVYLNVSNTTSTLWSLSGNQKRSWKNAQVSIYSAKIFRVSFEAIRGKDVNSDISIDDIEFLEKASSIFSGFNNDINQTLVETDVFNFIFVIVEYYSNSDILNRTVFKIVQNVIQTKGDEAQNSIRYMIEDTDLIQFLV